MNDDALLRSYVADRSGLAFTELVNRHIGLVYATALRRLGGDAHLADDVTQSVFSDLANKAPTLLGRESLSGWLYVSTKLATAAVVRAEQRRKNREAVAFALQAEDAGGGTDDPTRLRPVLDDAIVELRPEERDAVILRFFEQRSFAEIGATLRVTEEAARKRLDRALAKLCDSLSRRGVTSTAAALTLALTSSGATVPAGLAEKVAGTAVADTAAASTGFGTLLGPWAPAAIALLAGAALLVPQYRANQARAAEIAQLTRETGAIAEVRTERQNLAQAAAELTARHRIADEVPALRATLAALPPVRPAPETRSLSVVPPGMVAWEEEPVTLADFEAKVAAFGNSVPGGNSKVVIHAHGILLDQLLYVFDEVRKTGIRHVTIDSDIPPGEVRPEWCWF